MTTILDPERASVLDLATLYHERCKIETAFAMLKTHLCGARIVLRSKHFAIRRLFHEAALKADADPDRLSFLHAVRVIRRKLPAAVVIPPPGERHSMKPCSTKSCRSGSSPTDIGATGAASNER